mgnify:CR=1 FL=1
MGRKEIKRLQKAGELEALAAVSAAISGSLELEEVLNIALEEMLRLSGMAAGGIYLLDEGCQELRMLAHRGGAPEVVEQLRRHKLGHGLTGKAALERRVIVCPDVAKEFPQFREMVEQSKLCSQISFPLLAKGELVGVLNLNDPRVHTPAEEELQLLALVADQVAIALNNAQLLQREHQRARREAALAAIGRALSRAIEPKPFLKGVLSELLEALGLEIGAIYLLEGEEFVLAAHRGLSPEFAANAERNPRDHPILGRVIQSQAPLEVHEFPSPVTKKEGLKYATYVPLTIQGQPRGVLIVGARSEQTLKPEELKLLEAVGAQLSLALGQAEAVSELKHWREFTEQLLEKAPVGILRLDREGRILFENAALQQILGRPEEGAVALGQKLTELPNVSETGLAPELEALLRAGREIRLEAIPYTSLSGKRVVLSLVGLPLYDKSGAFDGALLLVEDVTGVWATEQLRESLLEVANEILSSEKIEPILKRVARAIVELSPFQRAAIALYDLKCEPPLEGPVVQAVAAGLTAEEEQQLRASGGLSPAQRRLAFSEEFRVGNSYYIPHNRVPWGPGLGLPGRVSLDGWHPDDFLFIPLRAERGIIGHISLDDPWTPQAVDARALEPLEVFAELSALAVERAAHLEELRRQKERLRAIYRFSHRLVSEAELEGIFQRALEMVEQECDYDYATLLLLDGEELAVAAERLKFEGEKTFLRRRFRLGEGIVGWVAEHRQPALVNDCARDPRFIASYEGIQAELAIPILFGEELLGALDVESKRKGAFKPGDAELLGSVASQLAVALKEREGREILRGMASRDPLTGLFNRRYFNEVIGRELERARRYGHHLAFLMIDLDGFREVNNTYGHLKGDEVLRQIAALLVKNVRGTDIVFRYGGDEFLILMPETDGEAAQAAVRLRRALEEWDEQSGLTVKLGLCIGIGTWSPDSARPIEEVLGEADRQLYRDKGRPR